MTPLNAIDIAEGFQAPGNWNQYIQAWQVLVDTGLAWKLPGRIGRTAKDLIDAGEISL